MTHLISNIGWRRVVAIGAVLAICLATGCGSVSTIVRTGVQASCENVNMKRMTCERVSSTVERLTTGGEVDLKAEAKLIAASETPERVLDFAAFVRSLKPQVMALVDSVPQEIEAIWRFTDDLFEAVHANRVAPVAPPPSWDRGLTYVVDCSSASSRGPCTVQFLAKLDANRSELSEHVEIVVPGAQRVSIRTSDFRRASTALLSSTPGPSK